MDNRVIACLATAIYDSENTSRLNEENKTTIDEYCSRAETILMFIERSGYKLVKKIGAMSPGAYNEMDSRYLTNPCREVLFND